MIAERSQASFAKVNSLLVESRKARFRIGALQSPQAEVDQSETMAASENFIFFTCLPKTVHFRLTRIRTSSVPKVPKMETFW